MFVLVAENDALHRALLKEAVQEMLPDCEAVLEASDGMEAISMAREHQPDFAVLDLQMPNASGVDAAKAIWREKPDTRILFWSNYADEAYVRGVAKIVPPEAVYGYVLKSASEERLRFAICGVFVEDQCVVDREVRGVQQRTESRAQGLTDAEFDILIDLALGLTDKAIAARHGLSIRGAQSRLQHLYEKLGLDHAHPPEPPSEPVFNSRTRAIHVAFSRGLLNVEALRREDDQLAEWLAHRRRPQRMPER